MPLWPLLRPPLFIMEQKCLSSGPIRNNERPEESSFILKNPTTGPNRDPTSPPSTTHQEYCRIVSDYIVLLAQYPFAAVAEIPARDVSCRLHHLRCKYSPHFDISFSRTFKLNSTDHVLFRHLCCRQSPWRRHAHLHIIRFHRSAGISSPGPDQRS